MILRYVLTIVLAILLGKAVSKLKLPAILGWLLAGMILGPHAFNLLNQDILDTEFYKYAINILECSVGLMIGTELVWRKIKSAGKQIVITTLTQSLGTFLFVSLVFSIVFKVMNITLYLAFLFGGIALATAPAPALSIVREFRTKGDVTSTLIPMAALDDMVGVVVFFSTIAIVSRQLSAGSMPIYIIPLFIFLPLGIGCLVGFISGYIMKKTSDKNYIFINLIISILIASIIGITLNYYILPTPILNFMLIGMAYSTVFSNLISDEQLEILMKDFNPILAIAMITVILNLGAPLDYHLIFGAGLFTVIYIVSRACGKYFGARFGATITHAPDTVKKYLGFTLLPHSGVSLVFTGIAVSTLSSSAPECAKIIQGTIAAAAVINEIIAVIIAKKGFEWAGELSTSEEA
ncbi:MAG: cation:proton antiporter [Intestinibacter sp.]|uniref:cation:proton antiporter n=1 Tax=Intestinibacter sp. TaxID=1965304 RepID=UPI002A82AF51|nr:cation:proton antiporter [Intestinibacter sp.]MDY4573856.1 cation:proton antiporter [Intestinibacter sp.]